MAENSELFPIGVVERDTGIGRDTLRIWERRYGFPDPQRNDKGERLYAEWELRRLQRIRRLLDQGLRPGKLVSMDEASLDALEADMQLQVSGSVDKNIEEIIDAITSEDASKVEQLLRVQLEQDGMKAFILHLVSPLITRVGELWMIGQLQIYQEHYLSQQLIRFLNSEISKLQSSAMKPRVLLATLPGEEHTLGLLMVAAMLSDHGVSTSI